MSIEGKSNSWKCECDDDSSCDVAATPVLLTRCTSFQLNVKLKNVSQLISFKMLTGTRFFCGRRRNEQCLQCTVMRGAGRSGVLNVAKIQTLPVTDAILLAPDTHGFLNLGGYEPSHLKSSLAFTSCQKTSTLVSNINPYLILQCRTECLNSHALVSFLALLCFLTMIDATPGHLRVLDGIYGDLVCWVHYLELS